MSSNTSLSEAERVISYINDKISAGELIVGSKLPTERALAEELDIGRNSAREAMSILSGMGIVERKQGSGSYISKDARKSVAQMVSMTLALGRISLSNIFEFRKMVDLMLAHGLISHGLTTEQKDGFTESLEHLEALVADLEDERIEDLYYWDERFHQVMLTATDNSLLLTLDDAIRKGYGPVIKNIVMRSQLDLIKEIAGTRTTMYECIIEKDLVGVMNCIMHHYELVERLVK